MQPLIQRMCLFGKFFIQNKSIYYEFDNFLFYILIENVSSPTRKIEAVDASEEQGSPFSHPRYTFCGFFSKEKVSYDDNNLSCIIIFPGHRRLGLGECLIDFSYHISRTMGKISGPEKRKCAVATESTKDQPCFANCPTVSHLGPRQAKLFELLA